MKTPLHTLAALAALTLTTAADTPDAILKDYRTRATQATQRLNDTLEKQATPLIAALVGKGDTAGAEALTAQVKAKLAGEPVAAPHVSAATLFAQYDGARATALKPVQSASIARLDSLLKVAGGPKIEALAEISKARGEIEAGQITNPKAIPVEWTYHQTADGKPDANIRLNPDGVFQIDDGREIKTGSWKPAKKGTLNIILGKDTWIVTVADGLGTIRRDVGTRYMRPVIDK